MAATKRRGSRASTHKRRSNTRRRSTALAVNPKRRSRRRNPVHARSHRRGHNARHHRRRTRRRNPSAFGGAFTEALNLTIAGFGVTLAAPMVNRFVGGFLPLGQFTQPVVFALTGFGVGWLANLTTFTRRFSRAAVVMGIALGATAVLTPWVRKFFAGASFQGGVGMSGWRDRYGMRGIAAVTGTPPNILPPPPPTPAVAMNQAMSGITTYGRRY